MVGVSAVSDKDKSRGGVLDLRSLLGVPACTPNSSKGVEEEGLVFLSPDPFSEFFGRFLPLSSVAWSWLPSPRSFGVLAVLSFSRLEMVDPDLFRFFLFLASLASGWVSADLRSSRTLST